MPDWAQQAADALDALGDSPSPAEVRAVTDRFEDTDLMAAIFAELLSRGGGGGGSQPKIEKFNNANVGADAGFQPFVRAFFAPGDVLLDYTDPLHPTIIEAGVYSVSLYIRIDADQIPAEGAFLYVDCEIDANSDMDPDIVSSSYTPDDTQNLWCGVSLTAPVLAGAVLQCQAQFPLLTGTSTVKLTGTITKVL